jgi:hypothetical protein
MSDVTVSGQSGSPHRLVKTTPPLLVHRHLP